MDTAVLVGIVGALSSFGGATVGASIPALALWLKERGTREVERKYAAVVVSTALDAFADACVDVQFDSGEPNRPHEVVYRETEPDFSIGDIDVDWRHVPADLMDRAFTIQSLQATIRAKLSWEAEVDHELPILMRQIEYGTLAQTVFLISDDLRRHANLPPRTRAARYVEHLNERRAIQAEAEEANQAFIAASFTNLTQPPPEQPNER